MSVSSCLAVCVSVGDMRVKQVSSVGVCLCAWSASLSTYLLVCNSVCMFASVLVCL